MQMSFTEGPSTDIVVDSFLRSARELYHVIEQVKNMAEEQLRYFDAEGMEAPFKYNYDIFMSLYTMEVLLGKTLGIYLYL